MKPCINPWRTALILVLALILKEFMFDSLFTDLFSHFGERAQTWWNIVSGNWLWGENEFDLVDSINKYGIGVNRKPIEELLLHVP